MRPSIEKLCQIIRDTTDYVSTYPFFCKGLDDFKIIKEIGRVCLVFRGDMSEFYIKDLLSEEGEAVKSALGDYYARKQRWMEQQLENYGID